MAGKSIYDKGLDKDPANYQPLTPLTLIERAAHVYPDHVSVIHGDRQFTWSQTYARSRRLASALTKRGIGVGDTVAVMAANIPEFYEATFGIPMAGAVINSLNIRLDAENIAFILDHGEAKAILTDRNSRGSPMTATIWSASLKTTPTMRLIRSSRRFLMRRATTFIRELLALTWIGRGDFTKADDWQKPDGRYQGRPGTAHFRLSPRHTASCRLPGGRPVAIWPYACDEFGGKG